MIDNYVLRPGSGDELTISEMTNEELIEEYNFWNRTLQDVFWFNTGTYDHAATMIREIDEELMRRDVSKEGYDESGQLQYRLVLS